MFEKMEEEFENGSSGKGHSWEVVGVLSVSNINEWAPLSSLPFNLT